MTKPLLPSGCYDILPPYARQESEYSHALLSVFEKFGYEQVSPSLLEYSDNLLAGRGGVLSSQIFRVMDSNSHKVMGIRSDITLQVARIARTRLANTDRPLRLCYNGLILRMNGEQLNSNRQLRQAGIELIGVATPQADAEVILVAIEALKNVGIRKISIDLNLPGIVNSLLKLEELEEEQTKKILSAIAHKDISSIKTMNLFYRDSLIGLIENAGVASNALDAIERLDLPDSAKRQCQDLRQVVDILKYKNNAEWTITIDATENRGASYHSGISFSIFVVGVACEVGRGGRYKIQGEDGKDDCEATGFTLYVETLLDILPKPQRKKRVLISNGINETNLDELSKKDFVLIYALNEYGRIEDEAKLLDCDFIYKNNELIEVKNHG